jgi:hypothetical protein
VRVSVRSCVKLLDGKWLITYRAPGAATGSAISDREVEVGRDAIIRDGRVVG